MEGVETIFNRPTRTMEESTRVVSSIILDNREFTQAHRYVLFNFENIYQFREQVLRTPISLHDSPMYARCINTNTIGIACRMHKSIVEDELRRVHYRISTPIIHKHHMEKFCGWFRSHVRLTSSTSQAFKFPISRITVRIIISHSLVMIGDVND